MIEKIKEKIWATLKDKEISLVMIFDDQGDILWHRGRRIIDPKPLAKGCGYCTTPIFEAMRKKKELLYESVAISLANGPLSESARELKIRNVLVMPVTDHYFLYVDSGIREKFSTGDITLFETLGSLLGGIIENLRSGTGRARKLSGTSALIMQLREKIARYAIEEDPVLLLGETGVGKSHVAELIHTFSGRHGSFVVVNTPGIPENLIEAQLFGHTKGAFSGAVSESRGFVGAAEHGTLFLDEIAEIAPALQAKLLRFIDTRLYHRVGETHERHADVRILAATNRDLQKAISQKTFREDLYYRLNCLSIEIPPLRDRVEDIPAIIADHTGLLRKKSLGPQALQALSTYQWPGNVRELLSVLKKVGIHFDTPSVNAEIRGLLTVGLGVTEHEDSAVERAWLDLQSGKNFWEAVKEPYLNRDLNREEVKSILARGLMQTGGSYKRLLEVYHLKNVEYKKLMNFLYDNNLK